MRREQGERERIDEKNVGRRVERDWSSERAVKRITRTLSRYTCGSSAWLSVSDSFLSWRVQWEPAPNKLKDDDKKNSPSRSYVFKTITV